MTYTYDGVRPQKQQHHVRALTRPLSRRMPLVEAVSDVREKETGGGEEKKIFLKIPATYTA
mgnify:CR=1